MTEDLESATLLDSFAWLRNLPSARVSFLGPDPDTVVVARLDETTRSSFARELATIVEECYPHEPLHKLFPTVHASRDIRSLGITTRAQTALRNNGCITVGSACDWSCADLATMRNTGRLTVTDIIEHVALDALRGAERETIADTVSRADHEAAPEIALALRSPALEQFLDGLRELSLVLGALGKGDQSPLNGFEAAEQTESVHAMLDRLLAVSAADLFPGEIHDGVLADALERAVGDVDDRAVAILRDRFFADDPATLEDIASEFGVTRERIRQIGTKAISQMHASLEGETIVATAAAVVRAKVTQTIPLDDLLVDLPVLRKTVASLHQPVWRVLDRLDDTYEIADGWVAAPTVAAAVARFRDDLETMAGRHKLVPISEVRAARPDEWITASRSNLRRWLQYCGMEALEGYVMVGKGSMLERAVAVLAATAEPLTAEVIQDRMSIERSIRSLKNQMSTDDRFVRVGRNAWGLAEWGMSGYTSIREAIRTTLEAKDGVAELSDLADTVADDYGVQRSSVIAYATAYPFESRQGVVRFAPMARGASKTPAETRRVYRRGADWVFRTVLTHDHMRGSGSLLPSGFASVLELIEGETATLPGPAGTQAFYWTGMQPSFGSVKATLDHLGLDEGDEVFFVLTGTGQFEVEKCRASDGSPRDSLLAALGTSKEVEVDDLLAHVAAAIGTPGEVSIDAVRAWLIKRGETDLALALQPALDE